MGGVRWSTTTMPAHATGAGRERQLQLSNELAWTRPGYPRAGRRAEHGSQGKGFSDTSNRPVTWDLRRSHDSRTAETASWPCRSPVCRSGSSISRFGEDLAFDQRLGDAFQVVTMFLECR